MKVLAWYINPTGIEIKLAIKYPYPIGIQKMQNAHYRFLNGIKTEEDKHQIKWS